MRRRRAAGAIPKPAIAAAAGLAGIALGALTATASPPPSPILRLAAALAARAGGSEALASSVLVLVSAGGLVALAALLILDISARLHGLAGKKPARWSAPPPGRWAAWAALAFLAAAAVFGFRAAWDWAYEGSPPPLPAAEAAPSPSAPAPSGPAPAEPAGPAAARRPSAAPAAAAAAALAAAVSAAAYAARRARRAGKAARPVRDGLAEAVAAARRRLETGDVARDAIVACYAEMCALYAPDGGREREARYMTAREFARTLRARGAEDPEIAALTSAFEKARYSNEPCGDADRLSAAEALRALEERAAAGAAR